MWELITIWNAFIVGIISACSMPLGALTSFVWQPKKWVLAFLIAFGGGALLAAVVIDLVGNAQEKGHIVELIVGSIAGSLFFTLVNHLINDSGGFLRKPSTLLLYLTQQETRLLDQRTLQLKHVEFFRDLPQALRQNLAQSMGQIHCPKGTTLYRPGDPSESLYIIDQGNINLLDPQSEFAVLQSLTRNELINQGAFFTGSPHQTIAVAIADTQLLTLSRTDFEDLLETSHDLVDATTLVLKSKEIGDYLQQQLRLSISEVQNWVGWAIETIHSQRQFLPAIAIDQKQSEFLASARQIRRFPVFNYLPQEDLEDIAARLVYQTVHPGQVFFQPSEVSDRLYFIHQGEVEVVYPNHLYQPTRRLSPGDALGELAFVTGSPHTTTAIAKTDGAVWILRRQDFEELLQHTDAFAQSVSKFLGQPEIRNYLHTRQNIEPTKTAQWVTDALENMNAGQLIPGATTLTDEIQAHANAPMSIWLGLLMDGIPEALTIGAHLSHQPISASFIAGLFIANYPEALSSSRGMQEQGLSRPRILFMWTSIMLITGTLAGVGSVVFRNASDSVISLLEATAAGAILTVIAETMLPEAYAKGGSIVGLATLLGFLVIIVIVTLEF